ncbi:MAG: dnaK 1 [Chthoniobacteraceae bacterium]|nr:dnaK 1 [Chthoniobacteraceae bacterium]
MKEIIVGIDLGTTNSAIAYVKDGVPEIIPIDGQPTMPSCVGIDPQGKLLVGLPARNMLIAAPESTIHSIKRRMGEPVKVTLAGQQFSPEEISSFILRKLKEEAEKFLGQPVKKAVITVPAFFDASQRKATQNAGELANLEVVRIINEPTAAALAYEAGHSDNERILVYDLGGGTFDVSVVVIENDVVEVQASHGDTHLGGDDFDELLVQRVVDDFHAKHQIFLSEDPKTMRRLKLSLERAKCALSDEPLVMVREEYIHGDLHLEMELQRADYEEMIEPYLKKTLDCIHKSLQDARLLPGEIAKVMLVGGSTRTPLVHQLIEANLNLVPRWEINPDLIVALGASISAASMAGEKSKAILVDITGHSFGIEALSFTEEGEMLVNTPIIHRGTPLPVSKSELFHTVHDNQREVEITVFEGEDRIPAKNTLVGQFRVEGLSEAGHGNPILVTFNLDLNGMLTVTATERVTGLKKSVTLDTRNVHASFDLAAARQNIMSLVDQDMLELEEPGEDSEPVDSHALLVSAKELRKRAEALLENKVTEEDAVEIRELLRKSAEAVKAKDIESLQPLNDSLSDIIFYLED